MKIHEYQAAELFKKFGIPVLPGEVTDDLAGAEGIAERIGYPVVLKSQVLVGGRGKAGGIKVASKKSELQIFFLQLRRLTIKGFPVERILVARAVKIQKEFYLAATVDAARDDVVLIASAAGGVDIEETARNNPQAIHKFYLKGRWELDSTRFKTFIASVFPDSQSQQAGTKIFQGLVALFFQYDCSLAEINPLVVDPEGQWHAADAKINFDDNALFRHPDVQQMADLKYEDREEQEAKQNGLSFVKLDGNVGCIVNGAGLAMATLDVIKLLGGQPANFLDVGGSSSPQKVLAALKIILRNPNVKSILVNIFGGITRCDDIANGIVEAHRQQEMRVPMAVRLTGTNEEAAKEILAKENISTYSSMRQAVEKAIELSKHQ